MRGRGRASAWVEMGDGEDDGEHGVSGAPAEVVRKQGWQECEERAGETPCERDDGQGAEAVGAPWGHPRTESGGGGGCEGPW